MKPNLLDVNLLIALAWPTHLHHHDAQQWFRRSRTAGFRTCPLTQLGFVRISSNPAFTQSAVAPRTAMDLLARFTALQDHEFWPDTSPLIAAIDPAWPLTGHKQLTDAYLLGLAQSKGGRVATLDRRLASFLPEPQSDLVELVGAQNAA